MNIRYYAPFAKPTGYARAAHDNLEALRRAGANLDIRPLMDCNTEELPSRYEGLLPFVNREEMPFDYIVVHSPPLWAAEFVTTDLSPPKHVKKAVYTTWETDKLPRECADDIEQNFDLVMVPSEHNAKVFTASGIDPKKIRVIPHCAAPYLLKPPAPQPELSDTQPFVFLNVTVWCTRKGPIDLLLCYLTEFKGSEDNVVLRILTPDYNAADVQHLVRCAGLTDLPRVEFITARLDDIEVKQLHENAHCFVSLTHGEGFGLGLFESYLVGNACVATDWSGHVDFLENYENYLPVRNFLTPAIAADEILGKQIEIAGMTIRPVANYVASGVRADQNWAQPDLHMAKMQMRTAYMRRFERKPPVLAHRYSYESIGKMFVEALESIR